KWRPLWQSKKRRCEDRSVNGAFCPLKSISLYTKFKTLLRLIARKKSFTFNEMQIDVVNFSKSAFTLVIWVTHDNFVGWMGRERFFWINRLFELRQEDRT